MFLHLGGEVVVRARDVIAILNVEKNKAWFRALLQEVQAKVIDSGPETRKEIKSVVITREAVYYSPISSNTLKKRAEHLANHRG